MRRRLRQFTILAAILFFIAVAVGFCSRSAYADTIPAEAAKWKRTLIADARFYFGLDVDLAVFFAQIHAESRWNANARSRVGALGLAQFMPATAKAYQTNVSKLQELCEHANGCAFNPRWAIRALVVYDRDEYTWAKFAMTTDDRWAFSLSSYNGGRSHLIRERQQCDAEMTCLSSLWFDHAERFCRRADWACKENRAYPRLILYSYRPMYRDWLTR